MQLEETSYQNIIENLTDGLYFVDRNRKITYWNKAAERITGFSTEEVVGRNCSDNILNHVNKEGESLCTGLCPLAESIFDEQPRETQIFLRHKKGQRILVSVRTSIIKNQEGAVIGGAELFTDISQQEASINRIKELEKIALLDNLTNIPNRKYIELEIEKREKEFQRLKIPFGLIFIDVDHFKNINDTYGHETGDEILKATAATLTASARPFDIIGRWGGEEFLGIIPNIEIPDLQKITERLRLLIENTYIIKDNRRLSVTVSIGGTLWKEGDTAKTLIHRADKLMYECKKAGRNKIAIV